MTPDKEQKMNNLTNFSEINEEDIQMNKTRLLKQRETARKQKRLQKKPSQPTETPAFDAKFYEDLLKEHDEYEEGLQKMFRSKIHSLETQLKISRDAAKKTRIQNRKLQKLNDELQKQHVEDIQEIMKLKDSQESILETLDIAHDQLIFTEKEMEDVIEENEKEISELEYRIYKWRSSKSSDSKMLKKLRNENKRLEIELEESMDENQKLIEMIMNGKSGIEDIKDQRIKSLEESENRNIAAIRNLFEQLETTERSKVMTQWEVYELRNLVIPELKRRIKNIESVIVQYTPQKLGFKVSQETQTTEDVVQISIESELETDLETEEWLQKTVKFEMN
ncbi:hypothetical protein L5515_012335 [Caenorhabditis briggsae]|uniref:Uncharacterized protein n=1 Tax=Caenorhabditis briggsae TaxID=6238 RepID=A0AAE9EYA4_CAEBR|nr:hypothetical protein L5515_012335 [Caenorhabditis briggsae]